MNNCFIRRVIYTSFLVFLATIYLIGLNRQLRAEDFLGQIIMLPYTFCPRDYVEAEGQLLSISQHQALFSLIGTQYGGDGRTTFALPKLHGASETGSGKLKVCICVRGIYPSRS